MKIRVKTPEIEFLSVALLSQARKSECGMAHNTLVDLIFVRTVSIPNLSLLPCLEVASNFFDTFLTHGQSYILRQHAAKKSLGIICPVDNCPPSNTSGHHRILNFKAKLPKG